MALVALVVAVLAMCGTVLNGVVNYVQFKKTSRYDLKIACKILPYLPVDFGPYQSTAFKKIEMPTLNPPGVIDESTLGGTVIFTSECRLSNNGFRTVSVQDLWTLVEYRHVSGTFDTRALNQAPTLAEARLDGKTPAFPLVVEPGYQIALRVVVAWPLEKDAITLFQASCPDQWKPGTKLGSLLGCLQSKELGSLTRSFRWAGERRLVFLAHTAAGFDSESPPYDLSEFDFWPPS